MLRIQNGGSFSSVPDEAVAVLEVGLSQGISGSGHHNYSAKDQKTLQLGKMVEKCSTYPGSRDKYCSKDCKSGIDTPQKVSLVLRYGAGRGRISQAQLT